MQNIKFDSGIKEFQINGGGVLRFNPSDLNVYSRFMDAIEDIRKVEQTMQKKIREMSALGTGVDFLRLANEADKEVKKILQNVFGKQNDFDEIFAGTNVLTVAGNGEMILTNFLNELKPIIEDGARSFAKAQAEAVKKSGNRAQRRAAEHNGV